MFRIYSDFSYNDFSLIFNELFDEISSLNKNDNITKFSPETDIIENDNDYSIELSLPGFIKDNIKLNIEKNNLIITGERKKDSNIKFNRNQSYYGEFKKSFILPDNVDKENITAKMENGILYININKKEAMKPININIE